MAMSEIIREERGWPGHYICADRCLFRRNTLLTRIHAVGVGEGDPRRVGLEETRIVVSTVGAMKSLIAEGEPHRLVAIGVNYWYETMAFLARFDDPYWDADISQRLNFISPWCMCDPPTERSDAAANAMHEAVVEELTTRLLAGESFAPHAEDDDGSE